MLRTLNMTVSSRRQTSVSQTTVQTSPVSPSPSSPNAETSCELESGEEKWCEWRLRAVVRCSSRICWPHSEKTIKEVLRATAH